MSNITDFKRKISATLDEIDVAKSHLKALIVDADSLGLNTKALLTLVRAERADKLKETVALADAVTSYAEEFTR